jgi:hypothetical protein
MNAKGSGAIVFHGSVLAGIHSSEPRPAAPAKGGIVSLASAAAVELTHSHPRGYRRQSSGERDVGE